MGRAKQAQIEEEEQGYNNPQDKYVCSKHFENAALREVVDTHAAMGSCDYCDRPYYHGKVVHLEELVAHMNGIIIQWFSEPDAECVPYSSSWVDKEDKEYENGNRTSPFRDKYGYVETDNRTIYNAQELFEEIGLNVDNGELYTDITACFEQHLWVDKDYFSLDVWEELELDWKEFCRKVKSSGTYSYNNLPPLNKGYFSENGLDDILTEIGYIINQYGLIKKLPAGEKFYRVRNHNQKKDIANFKELASPPAACVTSPNRMSPAGVSMFYASTDLTTSLKEAQGGNKPGEVATYGEFELTQDAIIIDFTEFPPIPDFWSGTPKTVIHTLAFLYMFAQEISKPVDEKTKDKEYLPTQIVTGYLEKVFSKNGNKEIDGMVFYSSKEKGIKNYVLFLDDMKCPQYLKLNYCNTL